MRNVIVALLLILISVPGLAKEKGVEKPSEKGEPDIGPTAMEKKLRKRDNTIAPYYPTGAPDNVHIYFIGEKSKLFKTKEDGWDIQPADDPFANVISMPDPEQLTQPKHVQRKHFRLKVQPGDTAKSLARRVLGRAGMVATPERIQRAIEGFRSANADVDFKRIVPGQVIRAPQFIRSEIKARQWSQPDTKGQQIRRTGSTGSDRKMQRDDSVKTSESKSAKTEKPELNPLPPLDTAPETVGKSSGSNEAEEALQQGEQPATTKAVAPDVQYTVQSGDAVSTIARDYLRRNYDRAPRSAINELTDIIIERNEINPDKLKVGQTLTIPSYSLRSTTKQSQSSPSQQPGVEYTASETTTLRGVALGLSRSTFGEEQTRQMINELQQNPEAENALNSIAIRLIELNSDLNALGDQVQSGQTIRVPSERWYDNL